MVDVLFLGFLGVLLLLLLLLALLDVSSSSSKSNTSSCFLFFDGDRVAVVVLVVVALRGLLRGLTLTVVFFLVLFVILLRDGDREVDLFVGEEEADLLLGLLDFSLGAFFLSSFGDCDVVLVLVADLPLVTLIFGDAFDLEGDVMVVFFLFFVDEVARGIVSGIIIYTTYNSYLGNQQNDLFLLPPK